MSAFKSLRSLFVVDTEDETSKATPAKPKVEPSPPRAKAAQVSANTSGDVNEKIVGKLLDAIDRNDMEGFDYLEFKRSLRAMDKLAMDEATKYQSVFATAATLGTSVDKLTSSAGYYLTILGHENDAFQAAYAKEMSHKVEGKQQDIEATEAQIEQKEAAIKKLQSEIDGLRQSAATLRTDVDESRGRIQQTRSEFERSYEHVKGMLEGDVEKINRYLR